MLLFDNTKQFERVVQQVLLSEAHHLGPCLCPDAVDAAQSASVMGWA